MEEPVVLTLEDFAEFKRRPPKKKTDYVKEVVAYSGDGIYKGVYQSVGEAAKEFGISRSAIYQVCVGRHLIYKKANIIFLYRGDDIEKRLSKIEEVENKRISSHAAVTIRINEYNLNGRYITTWPSIKLTAHARGTKPYLVKKCCEGIIPFVGNKIYLYSDTKEDIKERARKARSEFYRLSVKKPLLRGVDMYSLEGEYIKSFPSASAASREFNTQVSSITRCCHGYDGHRTCYTCHDRIFLWVGDSITERLENIKRRNNESNT